VSPRALVTGGASGIGAALVARLGAEGYEVVVWDLANGYDVGDPATWTRLEGTFDAACLNAGIMLARGDLTQLTDEEYRRIMRVNVDAVVYGVRALAPVMAGGSIAVTVSLAGLVPIEADPIYGLTKHALIGLVRSVAPALAERGVRINAICPAFADTPLVTAELREGLLAGTRLVAPEQVAEAAMQALRSEESGRAWIVQVGREPLVYEFRGVPGPR
jgi:NAD(P)-dependent dehydrogenase (short-subunit alcohol dehydrogenase family)